MNVALEVLRFLTALLWFAAVAVVVRVIASVL